MYTIEFWVYRFFVVVVPTLNMLITFSCFQVSNNRCRSYHPLCWLQFFFSLASIVWILYVLLRVIWSLSYFMFSESSESVVWCPNHFDKFSFIFFKYFFFSPFYLLLLGFKITYVSGCLILTHCFWMICSSLCLFSV